MRHSSRRPRDTLLTHGKLAEDQVLFLGPPAPRMEGSVFSRRRSRCPTHCTCAELFILRPGSLLLEEWIMTQLGIMSGNHSRADPLKPKPLHKMFRLFAGQRELAGATGSGFCRLLESTSWFSSPEQHLVM